MRIWKWLTKTYPLHDDKDVMARIGVRFLWCTAPYFVCAMTWAALRHEWLILNPVSAFAFLVPLVGGLLDWCRLPSKRVQAASPDAG
jgi:hypothetical protein